MTDQTRRLDEDPDNTEAYVHFGPGVPVPAAPTPPAPDRATALWRGEISPAPPAEDAALALRRRTQRWILPLTVLILVIAVLIYYLWGRGASPLSVNGATVRISAPVLGCGDTERLTATINTNGGAGTIEYQWRRSDGTTSDQLSQSVPSGDRHVSVVLDWNFSGVGVLDASATIDILGPGAGSAAASFMYHCAQR